MSRPRIQKFTEVVALLGNLVLEAQPLSAWPGLLVVSGASRNFPIALHVSTVSPHSRGEHEMRFQNPGNALPVSTLEDRAYPILLAMDKSDDATVFVAIDGLSRVGRQARFSILFNKRILTEAREHGWSVYQSSSGERIYAFLPALFPSFLDQIESGVFLPPSTVSQIADAAGAIDGEMIGAANRASRAVNTLVRKSGTGRAIRLAYGEVCCMCGIGSNLVVGAHIFPVEAPGSSDEIWNGLSLCPNHHAAFDLHLIWVDPETRRIAIHPDLLDACRLNPATKLFIDSTAARILEPRRAGDSPRREMFERRYEYFSDQYSWVRRPARRR